MAKKLKDSSCPLAVVAAVVDVDVAIAAATVAAAAGVVVAAANYFKGHTEREKKAKLSLVSSRVELELGSFEVFSVFLPQSLLASLICT